MMIHVEKFANHRDWTQDAVLTVYRALKQCEHAERPVLVFPKGVYHFKPDKAVERQVYITNHDQKGVLRTAFPLVRMNRLVVDGQGSKFIFHGDLIPFLLEHCREVTLRNFTIDWERPMFEQGYFVRADAESFDVRMCNPGYELKDNRLTVEYAGKREAIWGIHEIDLATRAHAFGSGDRLSWGQYRTFRLEEIGDGVIRFHGRLQHIPASGNGAAMRLGRREHPGIFLKNSSDTRIESVTIHHAPGMGLVAQLCTNIALNDFRVMLRRDTDRWVTATADATHFTSCRGSIVLERCLFENQLDDPLNVHGIYVQIEEKLGANALLVKLVHDMQIGVDVAEAGDQVRFVDRASLIGYASARVTAVEPLNARYVILTFEEELPDEVKMLDSVENVTWCPDLIVRDTIVRANRARGFLVTTPGRVLLERNVISAPGAGIKISGDANSWYESGAVRDVTIRENLFLDCNYCYPDWGAAVIDIDPEIEQPGLNGNCYHRNIRIENNEFHTFGQRLVAGHSVDGFVFRNNRVRPSGTFPARPDSYAIELKACRNVDISGNRSEREALLANIDGIVVNGASGVSV